MFQGQTILFSDGHEAMAAFDAVWTYRDVEDEGVSAPLRIGFGGPYGVALGYKSLGAGYKPEATSRSSLDNEYQISNENAEQVVNLIHNHCVKYVVLEFP